MNLFLPSDKCNGGDRTNRPKSGQRRENRQRKRQEDMKKIDEYIAARNDKALGMKVDQSHF